MTNFASCQIDISDKTVSKTVFTLAYIHPLSGESVREDFSDYAQAISRLNVVRRVMFYLGIPAREHRVKLSEPKD